MRERSCEPNHLRRGGFEEKETAEKLRRWRRKNSDSPRVLTRATLQLTKRRFMRELIVPAEI